MHRTACLWCIKQWRRRQEEAGLRRCKTNKGIAGKPHPEVAIHLCAQVPDNASMHEHVNDAQVDGGKPCAAAMCMAGQPSGTTPHGLSRLTAGSTTMQGGAQACLQHDPHQIRICLPGINTIGGFAAAVLRVPTSMTNCSNVQLMGGAQRATCASMLPSTVACRSSCATCAPGREAVPCGKQGCRLVADATGMRARMWWPRWRHLLRATLHT